MSRPRVEEFAFVSRYDFKEFRVGKFTYGTLAKILNIYSEPCLCAIQFVHNSARKQVGNTLKCALSVKTIRVS